MAEVTNEQRSAQLGVERSETTPEMVIAKARELHPNCFAVYVFPPSSGWREDCGADNVKWWRCKVVFYGIRPADFLINILPPIAMYEAATLAELYNKLCAVGIAAQRDDAKLEATDE